MVILQHSKAPTGLPVLQAHKYNQATRYLSALFLMTSATACCPLKACLHASMRPCTRSCNGQWQQVSFSAGDKALTSSNCNALRYRIVRCTALKTNLKNLSSSISLFPFSLHAACYYSRCLLNPHLMIKLLLVYASTCTHLSLNCFWYIHLVSSLHATACWILVDRSTCLQKLFCLQQFCFELLHALF